MRVVILAPHTDDEVLGCGGTIAKYIERGSDVYIYAFSAGLSNVKEFSAACRSLKAEFNPFTHFKTRNFNESRQSILDCMVEIRKQINPNIVFVPAQSDCHQDHNVITQEGIRAFKHSTIYGMEFPWNSFNFSNVCYNVLSPDHITSKVAAMQEYVTQADKIYFKEQNIISLARVRGMQAGTEYAECFEVIRQFI
jgi:LmbE family N-acetylglucosaminyl deacetylase